MAAEDKDTNLNQYQLHDFTYLAKQLLKKIACKPLPDSLHKTTTIQTYSNDIKVWEHLLAQQARSTKANIQEKVCEREDKHQGGSSESVTVEGRQSQAHPSD